MSWIALAVEVCRLILATLSLVLNKGGADRATFALKTTQIIQQLNRAKSPEDHENAAQALAGLVASMPAR